MKAKDQPFLHFDLGDFTKIDEVTGEFETTFIWERLEQMDVAGVCPGPRELTDWNTFRKLVERGTIPVIASNVQLKENGKDLPIGSKYRIYQESGLKVAVFSLLGGSQFAGVRAPEGVEFDFQDPFQAAGTLVPELRKQADLVVLLSEMTPGDTDRLVTAVPGIDVALYGQNAGWEEMAKKQGQTIVNQTGSRGQYLGKLILIVDPDGQIVEFGSQNAALDTNVAEDAETAKLVEEAKQKTTELRAQAREKRQSEQQNKLSGERFLGGENCKRCHAKQHEQWAQSPHAMAFAALEKPVEGKPRSPECVNCHVTGAGQGTGFTPDLSRPDFRPATQPDLANVQCEACHGRGTEHARTGKVTVPETTCRTCHTSEWSPDFDYEKALVAVKH